MNASNTNNFCNVNTDGSANNNNAYNSNGFAPGFKNNLGPEQVANCEAVPQILKENLTLGDWPAMRGLRESAKKRSEKSMPQRLAGELLDAAEGRGGAMKKRDEVHRMAEANKAFSHFRF